MSLEVLQRHQRVWSRKPTLRRVYQRYFDCVLGQCSPYTPIVELGSGAGFLKAYRPDIVSTDVVKLPWTDRVVDACDLPFEEGSVGNIVMIDVFHHLASPHRFLTEAERVLCDGGRVVLLEPWTSPLGYRFYRYIHHEGADRCVDPDRPFPPDKAPLDGNAALPELFFKPARSGRATYHLPHDLRVRTVQRIPAIDWLLTGGFQEPTPLPARFGAVADALESAARVVSPLIALRALVVIERQARESATAA